MKRIKLINQNLLLSFISLLFISGSFNLSAEHCVDYRNIKKSYHRNTGEALDSYCGIKDLIAGDESQNIELEFPDITFENQSVDFGLIDQGPLPAHTFTFT